MTMADNPGEQETPKTTTEKLPAFLKVPILTKERVRAGNRTKRDGSPTTSIGMPKLAVPSYQTWSEKRRGHYFNVKELEAKLEKEKHEQSFPASRRASSWHSRGIQQSGDRLSVSASRTHSRPSLTVDYQWSLAVTDPYLFLAKLRQSESRARFKPAQSGASRGSLFQPKSPFSSVELLKKHVRRVVTIIRICKMMQKFSLEKEIRVKTFADLADEREADVIKTKDGVPLGKVVCKILRLPPQGRTEDQIQRVVYSLQYGEGFRNFSLAVQRDIAKYCMLLSIGKRRVIVRQGHIAEFWYYIVTGRAVASEILANDDGTERKVTRMIFSRGMSFGELGVLTNQPRICTVRSQTPMQLLMLRGDIYKEVFFRNYKTINGVRVPEHIAFLKDVYFMRHWPWWTLLDHPRQCSMHYYPHEAVLVRNSVKSNYIYIVKSGRCTVYQYVTTSTRASWRDAQLNLAHPTINITGWPAAKTDTSNPCPENKLAYVRHAGLSERHLIQEDMALRPDLMLNKKLTKEALLGSLRINRRASQPIYATNSQDHSHKARHRLRQMQKGYVAGVAPQFDPIYANLEDIKERRRMSRMINVRKSVTHKSQDKGHERDDTERSDTAFSIDHFNSEFDVRMTIHKSSLGSDSTLADEEGDCRRLDKLHWDTTTCVESDSVSLDSLCESPENSFEKAKMAKRDRYTVLKPPVYVKVGTLEAGDVFGLDQMQETGYEFRKQSSNVVLISDGAEVIILSKRFFKYHMNQRVSNDIRDTMPCYPSELCTKARLRLYLTSQLWQQKIVDEYKEDLAAHSTVPFGVVVHGPEPEVVID